MLTLDRIDQSTIDGVTRRVAHIPFVSRTRAEEATMDGLVALCENAARYEDRGPDALRGLLYSVARIKALSSFSGAKAITGPSAPRTVR